MTVTKNRVRKAVEALPPTDPNTYGVLHDDEYVAKDLNVKPVTLAGWASRRKGPPFVKVGRFRRYPADDYLRWKASLPRVNKIAA